MNRNESTASLTLAASQKSKEKAYWLNKLTDHPARNSFPFDHDPVGTVPYRLETMDFSLPEEICRQLMGLSKGSGERLFIVLMTGVFILLRKYSGSQDIVVGMPVSRPEENLKENLDFINFALAIRFPVEDWESFRQSLSKMRLTLIEAADHQDFPIELVPGLLDLPWAPGEVFPLFDVTVSLKNIHRQTCAELIPNIMVCFEQVGRDITGRFSYNTGRYRPDTIARLIRHYQRLLEIAPADIDREIRTIDLLSEEEKEQILVSFNNTAGDFPESTTVPELIDRQAEQAPHAVALVYKEQQLSYAELTCKTDCLAAKLRQRGLGPDRIAAVIFDHSPGMVVALVGILKSGAAYLPIDPDYPKERIEYILKDSAAGIVVIRDMPPAAKNLFEKRFLDFQKLLINEKFFRGSRGAVFQKSPPGSANLAYIIYTSGSTGQPKGVMIDHRSFIDFTTWAVAEFEHCPGYQVLLSNSYASDGSIQQIFPPLISGGTLHLIDKELRLDVARYLDYLKINKINNIDEVPVLMKELIARIDPDDTGEKLPDLTCLSLGSEYVPIDLVKKCRRHLNHHGRIINAYGPAEASVETTTYHCDGTSESEQSLIGKPRRNTRVYILDEAGHCCPIGVGGEICISGVGLARGYLNQPELTAERFDQDLWDYKDDHDKKTKSFFGESRGAVFSKKAPLVIYKTGDRGCWLPDGNIRFLGRIDEQIKIRGHRVEPAEIETILKSHEGIQDVVVLTRETRPGEIEICTYYVVKKGTKPLAREFLEGRLPSYMMPSYLMELDKIPLTPHGKVDKKALPEPMNELSLAYTAPRDKIEKKLVELWAEILGKDKTHASQLQTSIGIDDNFFQLGGHSLKATIMIAEVHKELGVHVPLAEIFKRPFIRGLAEYIKGREETPYASIEPVEKKEYYELSSAQKRLYVVQQMDMNSSAYNIPVIIPLLEDVNIKRLEETIQNLLKRHESLRTSFHMIGNAPVQRTHDKVEFEIGYFATDVHGQTQTLTKVFGPTFFQKGGLIRPFDLSRAPLLRVGLLKPGEGKRFILVDMHHIITDGTSGEVLKQDFMRLYKGEEIPGLRLQYKDFAVWQNSNKEKGILKKQEIYWLKKFEGEIPVLNLPTDYPRPSVLDYEGDNIEFEIPRENTRTLNKFAYEQGVTLYMMLLAMVDILLAKLSGQEDIIIGTPVAGRGHADLEQIIGMFVNTVVLREYPVGEKRFGEFLAQLKENTLASFENQGYQFEDFVEKVVVGRDMGRNPLFDVMFVLDNINTLPDEGFDNVIVDKPAPAPNEYDKINPVSKFDLTITAWEAGQTMKMSFRFRTRLFKKETIERFTRYFCQILSKAPLEPGIKISEIEIIPGDEKKRILYDFNDTGADYPKDKTLRQWFEEQVEKTPDNIAVVSANRGQRVTQIAYRELNNRSASIAALLKAKNAKQGAIVGIMATPSWEMAGGIFGVLKAGCTFLPMEPGSPVDRINYVLNDSNMNILLTQSHLQECFNAKVEIVYIDDAGLYTGPCENFMDSCVCTDPVYVIYTSGTTGRPKGVSINNRNLVNYVHWFVQVACLTEADKTILTASFAFDMIYTLFFSSLLTGCQLHVIPRETFLFAEQLLNYLSRHQITYIKMTPSLFNLIVNNPGFSREVLRSLRLLMLGGEEINVIDAERAHGLCPHLQIMNHYGPTETTIGVIARFLDFKKFAEYKIAPTIGKPLNNARVYILDKDYKIVPMGVVGGLFIGGDGLGMGYLNKPELTTEKFIKYRSYRTNKTYIIYKTGDLARWNPDGNIQFLGRVDDQVKIRGYRVELGEIENHLLNYNDITEVVVIAREKADREKYLCAYFVAGKQIEVPSLREFLSRRLPTAMIPSYFIQLESMPLTKHNKLNRWALPEPGLDANPVDYAPPRSEIEMKLAAIWSELLGIEKEKIGIYDNFFEKGGHSLKAAVMLSMVHKELDIKIDLAQVFKNGTISGLAGLIEKSAKNRYAQIETVEKREFYALSSAQKRLYFLQLMEEASTGYNMSRVMELEGKLDKGKLENIFRKLIRRHESFRTAFLMIDGEPVQRIHEEVEFEIDELGVRGQGAGGSRGDPLWSPFIRPFDLSRAPLLRVGIVKLAEEKSLLIVDMHHIISDGASMGILIKDVMDLYSGRELPWPRLHYKDYTGWEANEREKIKRQGDFWLREFEGEIPLLDLPLDYDRPRVQSFEGAIVGFDLGSKDTRALKTLALNRGATLYMALLAIYNIFLAKITNQEIIVVGTPTLGRGHADLEQVIGMFVNTLALKNAPAGEKSIDAFLEEVKEKTLKAFSNRDYQYEDLVDKVMSGRDAGRNPLFDAMFVLQNLDFPAIEIPGLKLKPYPYESQTAKFDLTFICSESDQGLSCAVEYCTRLFKAETVQRFIQYFKKVVSMVLADPGKKIAAIELISEAEKEQILVHFNDTAAAYPADKTIHQLFEEQTSRTPDCVGLVGQVRLTYHELNLQSDRLAGLLIEKGVLADNIVAIMMNRSIEMVIGILGILKAGGAYLPIDPEYPQERINYMLKDSGSELLINEKFFRGSRGAVFQKSPPGGANLAYVIYTSGSTGRPKGVMVEHRNVVNVILWFGRTYRLGPGVHVLQMSDYTFDASVNQVFGTLVHGAALHVIPKNLLPDIPRLRRYIRTRQIHVINFVPSLIKELLCDDGYEKLDSLQAVISGAEKLEDVVKDKILALGYRLYNQYGPSETTVDALAAECSRQKVNLGKPIANVMCYIFSKNRNLLPVGIAGELWVSGAGVARGYLNNPELTNERFILPSATRGAFEKAPLDPLKLLINYSSPFTTHQSPIYKTGDLCKWLPDGNIEFLGRIDHQLKIRGFRIELGEIENRLLAHAKVKEAILVAGENDRGEKYLCAYVVLKKERAETIQLSELREYLARHLPGYMIPAYFVPLEQIPLTPTGKINRKALPTPQGDLGEEYLAPRNEIEKKLVDTWKSVLGIENIGINDNFFSLGGDSIKTIQIASRMNSAGYKVDIRDILQYPEIARLAPLVKKQQRAAEQREVTGTAPLTPIQKRFFENVEIDPHHYNQAVLLHSRMGFAINIIETVFKRLLEHHDALRLTYHRDPGSGAIIQVNHGLNYPLSLREYNLKGYENCLVELNTIINEIQTGINLENGPLMKLGLFHLDDGDRLLIVIHHLVIDGVSWRILFEDIETLYGQYQRGEEPILPLKTSSFKHWSEKLTLYANSKTFLRERDYWAQLEAHVAPPIPKDFNAVENHLKDTRTISFKLEEEETTLLLTKVNKAYRTEINDILLTALGVAVNKTFNRDRVLIALEGHGRETIAEDLDTGRTVGWFTTLFPILLNLSYWQDTGRQVKETKETLRKIPNKGVGYGILRYLTDAENKKGFDFKLKPQISFNYLGQFDADVNRLTFAEIAAESAGDTRSPAGAREYDIDVVGMIVNKRLDMSLSYNQNHFQPGTMETLRRHFQSELNHIIAHCSTKESTEFTPADFTYSGLTIEQIDHLTREYQNPADIYTLTPMQEGMLFHSLVDQTSYSYFEQVSYRLLGELDVNRLQKSLNELLKRHDILRTAFVYKDIERPVQVVLKERTIDFHYRDISKKGSETEKESFIKEYKEKDKQRSFDLSKDVLMRAAVFKMGNGEYEFIWSHPHILMDGWCTGILNAEFLEIYRSDLEQRAYQLPEVKPFREYIRWLEKRDKQESSLYWANYLEFYDEPAVIAKKIGQNGYRSEKETFILNAEKTAALNKLAARNRATLNTVLHATWGVLLGKLNGKEDVVFGAVVSGRPYDLEGVETMLGLFINTIPVRVRFTGKQEFNRLAQIIQHESIAGEPHHYHPLADIQSASSIKQNLIDHLFIFENHPLAEQIEGYGGEGAKGTPASLTIKGVEVFDQTHYDFNIKVTAVSPLHVTLQYNGNTVESEYVKRIGYHFQLAFDRIIEDDNLEIAGIMIPSVEEANRILFEFNNTDAAYPAEKTIHQIFEEQASRTPDHIAVGCQGAFLKNRPLDPQKIFYYFTYRQLNLQSDCLAGLLIEKGVLADNIVAIMMNRSIEMVIGIFGILKAGGAYMPIDPEYPKERIDYMLKDSGVKLLINEKFFRGSRGAVFQKSPPGGVNLAYVIYTSGSTGRPKGVMMRHGAVVNRLNWMQRAYPINENDVLIQKTPVNFDVSVWELFWWSFQGAALFLPLPGVEKNPEALVQAIEKHRVTTIHFVPSMLNVWLDYINDSGAFKSLVNLTQVFCSGEALEVYQVVKFNNSIGKLNQTKLINLYGPTEACVDVSYYNCEFNNGEVPKSIPIGKPIDNIQLYIVSEECNLEPIGIAGELLIGGVGLARGYLNRPELTAEKFDQDEKNKSFSGGPGGRFYKKAPLVYKTGDLARWLPDGNIEFLGRRDQQVKIRGFRIELEEIESLLMAHDWVKEAVVIPRQDKEGDKKLCAYVVLDLGRMPLQSNVVEELKTHLLKHLPGYMVPPFLVVIDKMPLTANGKLDRQALPEPGIDAGGEFIKPRNEIENGIVYVVADILGIDPGKISVRANFFNIGLNSITILKLAHRISEEFRINFPIGTLFTSPSVEGIAADMKKGYHPGVSRRAVLLNRKKAAQNLFLISGDGRIYVFKELALLLEGHYNVYGIQGKGIMDTGPLPETRREVHEDFLFEIKQVQPEGPYIMGGHCYGVFISYELTRILEERKNRVTRLIQFDEPALMTDKIVDHLVMLRWYNRYRRIGEIFKKAAKVIIMKHGEQKTINNNPGVMPEDLEARRVEVNKNYSLLYSDPLQFTRIIKAPLLVFKAASSAKSKDPRWAPETIARMSQTGVTLLDTPGDHLSMFTSPHVEVLAKRLIESI